MPLSGITSVIQQGGLGRRALSKDKVSGLIWYSDTLPAGFGSSDRIKKVYTIEEAEALGVLDTVTAVAVLHYHVSEFFRINPEGELYIGVFAVPVGAYDFVEITTMMDYAQGEIRQIGLYANLLDYVSTQVSTIDAVVGSSANLAKGYRASVLYAPNFPTSTVWSSIADLRALSAERVSVIVCQDGGGVGFALWELKDFTISALGAALGALSRAKVNQSIGNPGNFNMSDGTELETIIMADGEALLADATLGGVKDKGYLVMRKYLPRLSGSYFERVPTAVPSTSDYAWIEFQRTIDKAVRGIETALMPYLQSGVPLKSDGTLRDDTVGFYKDIAETPAQEMQTAGEISNFKILIDPAQNVQSTSTLVITAKIQPTPIAEFITLNIGLTATV